MLTRAPVNEAVALPTTRLNRLVTLELPDSCTVLVMLLNVAPALMKSRQTSVEFEPMTVPAVLVMVAAFTVNPSVDTVPPLLTMLLTLNAAASEQFEAAMLMVGSTMFKGCTLAASPPNWNSDRIQVVVLENSLLVCVEPLYTMLVESIIVHVELVTT